MMYDAIIVGGGLAGSTLAKSLAEHDYRVIVLEQEREFKDRVRGEQMHPWGVSARANSISTIISLEPAETRLGGGQPGWEVSRSSTATWNRQRPMVPAHLISTIQLCKRRS